MPRGYLAIILHAHLPYIKHGKPGDFAEQWLYEALTESYIPLLDTIDTLLKEGIDFNLTLSISPTLASMLANKEIQKRYNQYLQSLIELSEKEIKRTSNEPSFHKLAHMYHSLFKKIYRQYNDKYHKNLITKFSNLQDQGILELITTTATHAYLPLIWTEEATNTQIITGVENHKYYFNKQPAGMWLPECGYKPGLDSILAREKIKYFVSSSHGILYANPVPRYGLYAPLYTPAGVAAFGRDMESSHQVWSAEEGYPGDYNYREFYRDIGYDLDLDYLKPFLPKGVRKDTGLKYYRITGNKEKKEPYNPQKAKKKAKEHARDFLLSRQSQMRYLSQFMDRNPIMIAPYDAELFGHWWYEGPYWLYQLFKEINEQDEITTITPSKYLEKYPENQKSRLPESSWGNNGYHEVWLNKKNSWIYRHLHQAELTAKKITNRYQYLEDKKSIIYKATNQMIKELMLAQSSDWSFIITTGTMVDYACSRIKKHLSNFFHLAGILERGEDKIKKEELKRNLQKYQKNKSLFPFLDFKIFRKNGKELIRKGG